MNSIVLIVYIILIYMIYIYFVLLLYLYHTLFMLYLYYNSAITVLYLCYKIYFDIHLHKLFYKLNKDCITGKIYYYG